MMGGEGRERGCDNVGNVAGGVVGGIGGGGEGDGEREGGPEDRGVVCCR